MPQRTPDELDAELSAYLDGELPAERRQEVEQYLAASPAARRRLEELRAVSTQLAALPRLRAPDELSTALARHAERQLLWGESSVRRRPRIIRLLAQLSAAAAVLLIGVLVGRQIHAPAPPPTPTADRVAPARAPAPADQTVIALSPTQPDAERGRAAGRGMAPETQGTAVGSPTIAGAPGALPRSEAAGATPEEKSPTDEAAVALLAVPPAAAIEPPLAAADKAAVEPAVTPPVAFEPQPDPLITVTVTPQDAIEYLGTGLLLATWMSGEGASTLTSGATLGVAGAIGTPQNPAPVELTWRLNGAAATERLQRLVQTAGRQRVHLQTSFGPEDSFVVDVVARALASGETLPAADSATPPVSATPTVLARQQPPDLPEAVKTLSTKEPNATQAQPEAATLGYAGRGAGQPAARRREPNGVLPPRKGFDDRRTPEQIRADMEAQLRAATEEPEVVLVPPPDRPPPSAAAPTADAPASQPAVEQAERHVFFERLLALLFPSPTEAARALSSVEPSQQRPVTLRVRLVPPPQALIPHSQPSRPPP